MNWMSIPPTERPFPEGIVDADGSTIELGSIVDLIDDAFTGLRAVIVGWGESRGLEVLSEDDGVLHEVQPNACRLFVRPA